MSPVAVCQVGVAAIVRLQKVSNLFGQRLREIRESRDLTQDVVAQRAGLRQNHLSDIERGVKLPTLITLMRLAAALECNVADLVAVFDEHGAGALLRAMK